MRISTLKNIIVTLRIASPTQQWGIHLNGENSTLFPTALFSIRTDHKMNGGIYLSKSALAIFLGGKINSAMIMKWYTVLWKAARHHHCYYDYNTTAINVSHREVGPRGGFMSYCGHQTNLLDQHLLQDVGAEVGLPPAIRMPVRIRLVHNSLVLIVLCAIPTSPEKPPKAPAGRSRRTHKAYVCSI